MSWKTDQSWESKWHGNCANSYWEETKQQHYAKKMGLKAFQTPEEKYPVYDMKGKSVLDIGGGAYSMLLKCINLGKAVVVDPCDYPEWTVGRYESAGIEVCKVKAEEMKFKEKFDEVWIYNCLQHTINPEKIIENARKYGKVIRIFEWIDKGIMIGHPQDLKEDKLNQWLHGKGTVSIFELYMLKYGKCYYGVFKT